MVQEMRGAALDAGTTRGSGVRPAISSTSLVRVASMNLRALADRHDEGARPADHAILVIDVEFLDIHRAGIRPLEHDRQAVDGDAGGEHVVAHRHHQRPVIVGAVAGHVDHAAQAAIAAVVEQRLGEAQRAGNRGARGAPIGRARDLGGDRVGRFRPVDQPPRHDDLLVVLAGPFEIGDGDLAVGALAQRVQEFARGQRLHIALALQRLLVRVHRIGHVDGDHQFDVDRQWRSGFCRRGGGVGAANAATASGHCRDHAGDG